MSAPPGHVTPHRHQPLTLYGRERLRAQRQAAQELASRIADFVATTGITDRDSVRERMGVASAARFGDGWRAYLDRGAR